MGAHLARLPTAGDGEAGLEQLRDAFGDRNLFQHIRWVRDHRPANPTVGRMLERLAASALRHVQEQDPQLSYDGARQTLADQLGFSKTARPNLYHRYLDPGGVPRPGEEPLPFVPAPADGQQRYLEALPTVDDGEPGLRQLVDTFGTLPVFQYLRWLRDHRLQAPTVGRFTEKLAARMLHRIMSEDMALSEEEADRLGQQEAARRYKQARQRLADELNYPRAGTGRSYLYLLLRAGEEHLAREVAAAAVRADRVADRARRLAAVAADGSRS